MTSHICDERYLRTKVDAWRAIRYEKVLEALKNVPLSEFTVGQLLDIHRLVAREWDALDVLERLEKLVEERLEKLFEKLVEEPHPIFKHGMSVRYKNPKKGQRGRGIITSYPRRISCFVYVKGPRGWPDWARVEDLEIVEP